MVYTHPLDCQYYCYFGYKQHPNVSRVSCSSSGTWISTWPEPIVTADELCICKYHSNDSMCPIKEVKSTVSVESSV